VRRVLLLAVAVLAGCGGGGGEDEEVAQDPGVFMAGLVRSVAAGNYGKAWESLHPAHQRVAPRREYAACERRDHIPGRVAEVEVVRIVDEQVGVAGESGTSAGAAVTLRLRMADAERLTDTFHAVAVGDGWAWVLPPARYAAYRAGHCPR
jgi:hypothetical protein